MKHGGYDFQAACEDALFCTAMLFAFDRRYGFDAPESTRIGPGRRQRQGTQYSFDFSAATQTTGFHMVSMRFEFLEASLDIPAFPVHRQRRMTIDLIVIRENQEFAGTGSRRANAHVRFEGAADAEIQFLTKLQVMEKGYRFRRLAVGITDIVVLPQPHDEREAFPTQPGEPVHANEFAITDEVLQTFAAEQTQKTPDQSPSLGGNRISEAMQVAPQQRESHIAEADAENQQVVFVTSAYLPSGAVKREDKRLFGHPVHESHDHAGYGIEIESHLPEEVLKPVELRFSQRRSGQSFDNSVEKNGLGFDGAYNESGEAFRPRLVEVERFLERIDHLVEAFGEHDGLLSDVPINVDTRHVPRYFLLFKWFHQIN
jgi:hypothetical protein